MTLEWREKNNVSLFFQNLYKTFKENSCIYFKAALCYKERGRNIPPLPCFFS